MLVTLLLEMNHENVRSKHEQTRATAKLQQSTRTNS